MNPNTNTPVVELLQSGDLLNEAEAARILGLSKSALRNWRSKGKGPNFVKLQGSIRYRRIDLTEFAKLHVVQQAPEKRAPAGREFINLE